FRSSVSDPSQVLDDTEVKKIKEFSDMLNSEIKTKAAAMGLAVADFALIFDDIQENGRPISSPSGYSPGSATTHWPLQNKPGVFGLDGVHPNMYGHSVMANELIKVINTKYGVNIAEVSEYTAWYYDTLNQNPVDLKSFLSDGWMGQFLSWVISIFA
ncbi:MAG: hypothetical protein KDK45_22915, partial [Leptospiraceae bacterium]|nr:hypothetical protein [Leptospiraceae bacterium]